MVDVVFQFSVEIINGIGHLNNDDSFHGTAVDSMSGTAYQVNSELHSGYIDVSSNEDWRCQPSL